MLVIEYHLYWSQCDMVEVKETLSWVFFPLFFLIAFFLHFLDLSCSCLLLSLPFEWQTVRACAREIVQENWNLKVTHLTRAANNSVVHVHSHTIKYNEFMHEQACISMVISSWSLDSDQNSFCSLSIFVCVCVFVLHIYHSQGNEDKQG